MTLAAAEAPALKPVAFYYLRHGETDWNRWRICQGHTDIRLNDAGRRQAAEAAARLKGHPVETLCVSPLARARETAEIVNAELGRPLLVLDDLRECGFGSHEGVEVGDWWHDWLAGHATPEGAEAYEDFLLRALAAVNQALAQPGPVLIVAHGGIYWAVQRYARLQAAATLANAVPVWHEPPIPGLPEWRTELL
jgi:2,3-bisphosphoglycerate-dependent phosphoglycerate mutase